MFSAQFIRSLSQAAKPSLKILHCTSWGYANLTTSMLNRIGYAIPSLRGHMSDAAYVPKGSTVLNLPCILENFFLFRDRSLQVHSRSTWMVHDSLQLSIAWCRWINLFKITNWNSSRTWSIFFELILIRDRTSLIFWRLSWRINFNLITLYINELFDFLIIWFSVVQNGIFWLGCVCSAYTLMTDSWESMIMHQLFMNKVCKIRLLMISHLQ